MGNFLIRAPLDYEPYPGEFDLVLSADFSYLEKVSKEIKKAHNCSIAPIEIYKLNDSLFHLISRSEIHLLPDFLFSKDFSKIIIEKADFVIEKIFHIISCTFDTISSNIKKKQEEKHKKKIVDKRKNPTLETPCS